MLFKRDGKVEEKGYHGKILGYNKTGRKAWDGTVLTGNVKIPLCGHWLHITGSQSIHPSNMRTDGGFIPIIGKQNVSLPPVSATTRRTWWGALTGLVWRPGSRTRTRTRSRPRSELHTQTVRNGVGQTLFGLDRACLLGLERRLYTQRIHLT